MADGEQTEKPDDEDPEADDDSGSDPSGAESSGGGMFTSYGIASTVLAVLSVAAIVLGGFIWNAHRGDVGERTYLSRVMQTAAEWTDVLINMNTGNLDASLQRLHDRTVGQLNSDFDAAVQPYRQVVQKL